MGSGRIIHFNSYFYLCMYLIQFGFCYINLSIFGFIYDFVDYVTTNESFTKRFYDKEDIQGYEEEMRDRLHRMLNLTKTKKYK